MKSLAFAVFAIIIISAGLAQPVDAQTNPCQDGASYTIPSGTYSETCGTCSWISDNTTIQCTYCENGQGGSPKNPQKTMSECQGCNLTNNYGVLTCTPPVAIDITATVTAGTPPTFAYTLTSTPSSSQFTFSATSTTTELDILNGTPATTTFTLDFPSPSWSLVSLVAATETTCSATTPSVTWDTGMSSSFTTTTATITDSGAIAETDGFKFCVTDGTNYYLSPDPTMINKPPVLTSSGSGGGEDPKDIKKPRVKGRH